MKLKPYTFALLLALPLSGVIAGCGQSNQGGSSSMENTNGLPEDTNGPATSAMNSTNSVADNSGINARDRDTNNLTPGDQGNSPSDIALTQRIRKQLVMDTDYSMTAKNIKIITINGQVTLRGPVNSDNEKSGIQTLAQNIAGNGNVDNQLEVITNPVNTNTTNTNQ
jgi:hyperosmotically inducible periplasmic protein